MMMPQRDIEAIRRVLQRWQDLKADPDYETFAAIFGPRASEYWDTLCQSYDWHNAPEEFPGGEPTGAVLY